MDFDQLLASYDYSFPAALIAKEPASPRESARLLIYDRRNDRVTFDTFAHIDAYLPQDAVLVFNKTKVIPAKMTLKKKTGGMVSALIMHRDLASITVLASGHFTKGDTLDWKDGLSFSVRSRNNQEATLEPHFGLEALDDLLEKYGETPLPPYMKDSPLPEEKRRKEYQTVFAIDKGSIAAPTAGLHFSESLIKKLEQSGRMIAYISLHVGLGTFAPLKKENVEQGILHQETYTIDSSTAVMLNEAKAQGRPIIAIGTTSVRALESASIDGELQRLTGSTNLFITEKSQLTLATGLITNFHVPRSSLLMLVSAFTGREKLLKLYEKAISERMRLFSFGDGMLVL